MTSVTFRPGCSDGGDTAAWFASIDGSLDFTKLSELLEMESNDCGPYVELIESRGLGGGGVGDFRIAGDAGLTSPGFGDAGRTNGSGFDDVAAEGIWIFNGGGGIIPLLWSTLLTTGRDIEMSGPSLIGAGALRLITLGAAAFDFSANAETIKKITEKFKWTEFISRICVWSEPFSSNCSGVTHFSLIVERLDSVRVIWISGSGCIFTFDVGDGERTLGTLVSPADDPLEPREVTDFRSLASGEMTRGAAVTPGGGDWAPVKEVGDWQVNGGDWADVPATNGGDCANAPKTSTPLHW